MADRGSTEVSGYLVFLAFFLLRGSRGNRGSLESLLSFLCVATLFWILYCDRLLRGRNNAKYIITMAFVFSSLSKPKDGGVKVEYFYGKLSSVNLNADLSQHNMRTCHWR